MSKTLVVTSGEPAGIGPDLVIHLAHTAFNASIVVLGDKKVLCERAEMLGIPLKLREFSSSQSSLHRGDGSLSVHHIATAKPVEAGRTDTANARYVLQLLEYAIQGCRTDLWQAIVTAPLHKAVIIESGVASFVGHTEYLAQQFAQPAVMMLANQSLRVALVTTHLPLRQVAQNITPFRLEQTLRIVNCDLVKRFHIEKPRIGVCGLNPHAGEEGHLGDEEQRVIIPVIRDLRKEGMDISDPLPADTIFVPHQRTQFDVIVAMYHDQGLPVIKHNGFGDTVNITLGLPYVRTSVDHGTALSLAGKGQASPASLFAAIRYALSLM